MSLNNIGGESSYWGKLLQSEGCLKLKHTGIIVFTALAVIGLFVGVLLAMAQQGHDLAGINALAQRVPQGWLYLELAVAGTAFVLASVFTVAQIVNHLKPN